MLLRIVRLVVASVALIGCGRFGFDSSAADDAEIDAAPSFAGREVSAPSFATFSATYVDVPGSALTVPASPGQTWLLLVSATLQSSSLGEIAAEARYLVDGVEAGIGGTQNSELDRPGPWQHFYVFAGKPTPTEITFQLRDGAGGTATIDQLRAVAVPLPASADPLYTSSDPIQEISLPTFSSLKPVATLTLTPASAGDYVVFLLANTSEGPGASDVFTRWLDPAGQPWNYGFLMPRQPWQSNLIIRRMTLGPAPATIVMEARTEEMSSVRNIRVLALRTTGLAAFDLADSVTRVPTTAATPTTVATLVPAASSAAQYVAIESMQLDADCSNAFAAERRVHYGYGTATGYTAAHVTGNCAYETTYGTVHLLSSRPTELTAAISSGNGELVNHIESSLVLIGIN